MLELGSHYLAISSERIALSPTDLIKCLIQMILLHDGHPVGRCQPKRQARMMKFSNNILTVVMVALCATSPVLAQEGTKVEGYWSGGYTDGQGGEIQFEMTVIGSIGELKYNATNWGPLGFAICEYLFPVENGTVGKVTRNSGAGTGECLETPSFTMTRPNADLLTLAFSSPEIGLESVELAGILRPFDPAEAHAPVADLDILGITPGMTEEAIVQALSEKGYERHTDQDRMVEFDGFSISQLVWAAAPEGDGQPVDWVFATFSSKKSWAPDDVPVAMNIGRDWSIPDSAGISGSTMVETLAKKYGAPSNTINEDRMYDRAGNVLADAYTCPEGPHQALRAYYQLASEVGEADVFVTCGPVLNGYVGTDSATGRAVALKLRITDPDPIWHDFWQTWSHTEAAHLKSVYDGVTSATGAAPEL